ncbi:MAG TPA: endonuclease/exonuclease/phosphatase family protein [Actinomycetota bacterium]|nr:endonuclease/exonuclease/phosphatase family protein [Actinomycetota bacterium]
MRIRGSSRPPTTTWRVAVSAVVIAMVAVACTGSRSGGSTSPSASQGSAVSAAPVRFKLMEFNIEYGGTQVDFDSVPKAIKASGTDVVGIEEGYATMPKIAKALGWNYYDERTQIVSRFPLLRPADGSQYTYVEVAPGRVVAIANEHLPSWSYGPDHVRNGMPLDKILHVEETLRVPAVKPAIEDLAPLAAAGVPSFIMGDFNTPSHLDWTAAALRDQPDRFPVDWPVGEAVEAAGFRDSYRQLFPDPVKDPGLTWPANRPFVAGYNPYRHGDPRDRIDFIYDGGPATPVESKIVGEGGVPGVDIVVSPWPTDHRGEVTTFEVTPAVPPVLLSADRRLITTGDAALVRYHAPGADGEHIVVVPAGGDPTTASVADAPTTGTDGAVEVRPASGWTAGAYDAVLLDANGQRLAITQLWVESPGQEPVIATGKATYGTGEPIDVTWNWAPGNRWDWLGIYRRHAGVSSYLDYIYTGATVQGTGTVAAAAEGAWPLKPGKYSVYLLRDDDYVKLASADFTITP